MAGFGIGWASEGLAVSERMVRLGRSSSRHGPAVVEWLGLARLGSAAHGGDRRGSPGVDRQCWAGHGRLVLSWTAWQSGCREARSGTDRWAGLGVAVVDGRSLSSPGKARWGSRGWIGAARMVLLGGVWARPVRAAEAGKGAVVAAGLVVAGVENKEPVGSRPRTRTAHPQVMSLSRDLALRLPPTGS